ncbi:MAG: LamG domain-containing protein [Ignavibacteria bacterium]|nr:MAG: LamG domain-containing protein [Ignavibacteria bacterium]
MKLILYSVALVLIMICSACRQETEILTSRGDRTGKVSLSLAAALHLTIADSGRTASGSFTDVPVGTWHLAVDALNDTGAAQYSGKTDLDVLPGQTIRANLELLSTSGGIDIVVTWGAVCVPVPSGLVSWWRGERNAADAAGVNNGTLVGGVAFATGKVGDAFNFDGYRTYVRVPNSSTLNAPGSFTLESWIYPTRDTLAMIAAKWGFAYGWENQRSYSLNLWPGRNLNFGIADDTTQLDSAFQDFRTEGGVLTLNAWNHVAAVYDKDAGTRRLYSNGVKVAERVHAPIQITQGIADLSIGAYLYAPSSTWNYFPGRIDEVSFYHRALSGDEIASIYNAGSAGKCR